MECNENKNIPTFFYVLNDVILFNQNHNFIDSITSTAIQLPIYCWPCVSGSVRMISESPGSVMDKVQTRKYLPHAVPNSMLLPLQWWTPVLANIAQYSISDFLFVHKSNRQNSINFRSNIIRLQFVQKKIEILLNMSERVSRCNARHRHSAVANSVIIILNIQQNRNDYG